MFGAEQALGEGKPVVNSISDLAMSWGGDGTGKMT